MGMIKFYVYIYTGYFTDLDVMKPSVLSTAQLLGSTRNSLQIFHADFVSGSNGYRDRQNLSYFSNA